jgi:hypothetical protein
MFLLPAVLVVLQETEVPVESAEQTLQVASAQPLVQVVLAVSQLQVVSQDKVPE